MALSNLSSLPGHDVWMKISQHPQEFENSQQAHEAAEQHSSVTGLRLVVEWAQEIQKVNGAGSVRDYIQKKKRSFLGEKKVYTFRPITNQTS